jgi:hypothetical protein
LNDDTSTRDEGEDGLERESEWRVDRSASRERLQSYDPAAERAGRSVGGWLIYTDEHGVQRRLPENLGELSTEEIAAAARATARELGAPDPSYAKVAAIERLNELRSAGAISEENYLREKRRIMALG